jgi:hypothetical protein
MIYGCWWDPLGKGGVRRGRRMKDDGLTFVFFRKLQSAGVSPTSFKSLALNDTFNNFSLPCFWPVGWRKVKIKQPHHTTHEMNLSTGLHISSTLYIDQAPRPNHGGVDRQEMLYAWQLWESRKAFQPKTLVGRLKLRWDGNM